MKAHTILLVFLDRKSIMRIDNNVYLWFLENRHRGKQRKGYSDILYFLRDIFGPTEKKLQEKGQSKVMSKKSYIQIDCKEKRYAYLESVSYSRYFTKGKILSKSKSDFYMYPKKGKLWFSVIKQLC